MPLHSCTPACRQPRESGFSAGLSKKENPKTVFLTFSPPTWRGNSPEAPPVRRHKMKAAQCRTRLQTQSPWGTWKPHACPHSLEHHPHPRISHLPLSACLFPLPWRRGAGGQRSPPRFGACCPRACPLSRGGGRTSARELSARAGHTRRSLAVMGPLARARVPLCAACPWGEMGAPNTSWRLCRHCTSPTLAPQGAAQERLGAPRARNETQERSGRVTVNLAHKYGLRGHKPRRRGRNGRCGASGIAGSRGGRCSAGSGEAAPQCSI